MFGPEDHGPSAEHVTHCRWLVRIPSNSANPSFNLSQAVLLALFELTRRAWPDIVRAGSAAPAPMQDFYHLDRLTEEALTRSGFLGKGAPRPMRGLVRHLLRRIEPNEREMRVLLGMFDHINRTLSGRAPAQPWPVEPAIRQDESLETCADTDPGLPSGEINLQPSGRKDSDRISKIKSR